MPSPTSDRASPDAATAAGLRPWRPARDAAAVLAAFSASADLHRQGLASRALDTFSLQLFADGLHRLELGARANNPASLAVAERAGYVREGVERERLRYLDEQGIPERFDIVRFARLATDPAPGLEPLETGRG